MTRRWLITGCSSGLGRALAGAVAGTGDRVLATARRPDTLADLRAAHPSTVVTAALDVTDPDACRRAVGTALEAFGGVDVLVNNAGYGQAGAVEELGDAELAAQFATNVFGPWRLTREVLPSMRERGHGRIVMVSSVVGRVALPGLGAYVASKHALEGLAETLALELAGTGVSVTAVEPGMFATNWGTALAGPPDRVDAYRPVVDPVLAGTRMLADLPGVSPPALFADEVIRLVDADTPPLRLPIGPDAWDMVLAAADQARTGLLAARTPVAT
jgi:NAD(P)-dependent dehydrogenase (short-subunit alcohol dehydrogenase family)